MNKIIRLSVANIKKHKRESVLLTILIIMCAVLLSSAVASMAGIARITPDMVAKSGCFKNMITISQGVYSDRFLVFFENAEGIERFVSVGFASENVKILEKKGTADDKEFYMSFMPVSSEKKIESFDVNLVETEHPIYLDNSCRSSMQLSEGDKVTFTYKDREFAFTVAGFYQAGIWMHGSKAVVSEEDYKIIEQYLERYEYIGVDTTEQTDTAQLFKDFKDFCKDVSINDVSSAISLYTYNDTVTSNRINMSLLSIIIVIMAGIIVIAVMVMIRFRIVSDIREKIVTIGVLEALGYRSHEIALSYVAEYLLIAVVGIIISIYPTVLFTRFLLDNAAASIHYGGVSRIPVEAFFISGFCILAFVGVIALSKAMSVRKYPPVMAFRKGIDTHHFQKNVLPLENTKNNIHLRLALKGFIENLRANSGITVTIAISSIMVVSSFIIGSFFSDSEKILNSVAGHELNEIRIETVGAISSEAFAAELEAYPEVEKVLMSSSDVMAVLAGTDESIRLEIYSDYARTENLVLTEGRLPLHDNELAVTTQVKKMQKLKLGDKMSLEYGRVKRDYIVTGFINSVIEAKTAYLTTDGFKRISPSFTPDAFNIYLKDSADKDSFAQLLTSRYGRNVEDIMKDEPSGDSLEEKIRSAAEIAMAKAMVEEQVGYMEYSVKVGDMTISGSTSSMKIRSLTFVRDEYIEMLGEMSQTFSAVSIALMLISMIIVMLILSILMTSTIRKRYRELGIMKGMGYTSKELMFQMAFQIVPSAFFAVLIGTGASILLMGVFERFIAKLSVSVTGVIVVDIALLIFCFVCAFVSAGKIKRISVYELMTE